MSDETSRAILYLLYEGRTFDEIFQLHPTLTVLDISRAAGEGLTALEERDTAERTKTRVLAKVEKILDEEGLDIDKLRQRIAELESRICNVDHSSVVANLASQLGVQVTFDTEE